MNVDENRWGMSRRAVNDFRRVYVISSAGVARAIEESMDADENRWGASGGAAFAPPDFQ